MKQRSLPPSGSPAVPRLAVVTGAASGIGLATGLTLAGRGAHVVGVDLAEAPPQLAEHDRVDWIRGNVAEPDTWERVRELCARRDPAGADALLACAGTIVVAPFLETAVEDWRKLFEINVLGVIRGMQTLIPGMVERGGGAIAVVCSVDSLIVEEAMSAYATSKAALLHAVRSAGVEHAADGIRINAVCPGVIDTPLLQRHFDSLQDPGVARMDAERRTPMGRLLQPEEIAEVLCFLVGPGASAMAGASVTVDGGLIATYAYDSQANR